MDRRALQKEIQKIVRKHYEANEGVTTERWRDRLVDDLVRHADEATTLAFGQGVAANG